MPQDVIGVPTEDQALAAVGGGDRDNYGDQEKEAIAARIRDAAISNTQWRASLPFDQQIALAQTPTVSFPPAEAQAESGGTVTPQSQGQ